MMYYFTPDTIVQANKNIEALDPKVGGLLCVLSCLAETIEENVSYTINGEQLRKQLSFVFDKEPKDSFDGAKPSYIIFAKGWATTFFENYIRNKVDLLSCAVFFLRRYEFEREYTKEEVIDLFVERFKLGHYKEQWFFDSSKVKLAYTQTRAEDNQSEFYLKMGYNIAFKSILFRNVIQKSAADLKAAGQIQTLYSGSGIHTCLLLSDEPLDQYYIMSNATQVPTSTEKDSIEATFLSIEWFKKEAAKYAHVDEEAAQQYQQFQSLYSPERLRSLPDDELLSYIFLGANDHSMCNALEYDSQYAQFGSIAGAVAYNYFLFYSKSEGVWKTAWGEGGQREVSPEDALIIGKQIRDALVRGADIIASSESLATANDYGALLDQLNAEIPQFMGKMWCFKYYHMLFPNLLPVFYSEAWQKHILCSLSIVPSDARFVRMGQISTFTNACGISSVVFSKIIIDNLGAPKTFYRIGTGDKGSYFEEWYQNNYVAIGWNGLGDLSEIYREDSDAKVAIIDALKSQWNYDNRLASRKYREINNFYSCVADNTFAVAMAGQKLYAIGVIAGSYFFDEEREYAHCRPVRWLKVFRGGKTLPLEAEGKLTTFVELKNAENLCYLYQLLYGNEESPIDEIVAGETIGAVRFCTGYKSDMPRNRILFGAPGTGKSFMLNCEKDALLAHGGEYERVTFHPDYSYANFVGTYKPVPCKDHTGNDVITYSYVPGPFMRTYVKALLNSRTDTAAPYLLVIEEINRANVAAVFGDVFQLLDRGDDEVSEYAIQASEDIKKYLADELGGHPDDYSEIRIPDNMFIWATMNSADQGVFPMDTAFKRRWDFTYLGIDDSEAGIVGKKVILGKGDHRKVVEWNELRKAINKELLSYRVNEDKLMGPYFISKKMLPVGDIIDPVTFARVFKNKVIMYLFDDAAKQKRITLFGGCEDKDKNQYSKICAAFDTLGVDVFCDSISSMFIDKVSEGVAE